MPVKPNLFGFTTQHLWTLIPLSGYFLGKWLDKQETLTMISFRDKSALYGRPESQRTTPSWPQDFSESRRKLL